MATEQTIPEQIDTLVSRGMTIDDDADRWLRYVGYHRLSGYWLVYQRLADSACSPQRSEEFDPGCRLSEVVALYEFDRRLRTLTHDGIERVEVGLRRMIVEVVVRRDPLAHRDPLFFRPGFDHQSWMRRAESRIDRSARRSRSLQSELRHHDRRVPIWVLVELLDFADLSLLFQGMRAEEQWAIAGELGIAIAPERLTGNQRAKALRHHPLANWLEQLTLVRNICAHHARLWNRTLIPAGTSAMRTVPGLESLPTGQTEKVYGSLRLIASVLATVSPGSRWWSTITELVDSRLVLAARRAPEEMGFPRRGAAKQ